jgi:hypothetical protein
MLGYTLILYTLNLSDVTLKNRLVAILYPLIYKLCTLRDCAGTFTLCLHKMLYILFVVIGSVDITLEP